MIKFPKNRTNIFSTLLVAGAFILVGSAPSAWANALGDPAARTAGRASGDGLTAVTTEVKAGEITVGSSNQVVVKFRNDSGRDIKVGQINLYPSSTVSAEVALDECGKGEALSAGAECAVVVSIKGLKVGNWRVEVLLRHDGKSRIVTSALTGTVAEGDNETDTLLSDVEMIPNEIDFGSMTSSRPLVKSVILRNITSKPIQVKKVSIQAASQSGYSLSTDCEKLDVGQACVTTVTWSPVSKGKSDGVLIAEHDGPTRVASVNLKGSYDPEAVEKASIFPEAVPGEGLLVSSQEELNFGTITNEASMTVSLVNVGERDLRINDLSLGSSDKGLTVTGSGCKVGQTLKPVEACALTVNWSPVRAGEILEDVKVTHNGARGVLVLPIRGTADSAINKDTKAVVVSDLGIEPIEIKPVEKKQALEGFVITSHSPKKAIINGPGGSRVVSDGQDIVLGGVEWKVNMIDAGVEFLNGMDRVRLLFDRSLSSASRSSNSNGSTSTQTSTTVTP